MIAFDNATNGGLAVPATTLTYAHTCSGSDRILFVTVFGESTDILTSVTYGGVSMSLVGKTSYAGDRFVYLFVLIAPATGSNNVVVTMSGSAAIASQCSSYTGANQSSQPDAYSLTGVSSVTTLTTALTTISDNCWTVAGIRFNSVQTLTAGSGTVVRESPGNGLHLVDSNSVISPAGSTTLNATVVSAVSFAAVMASFSPVPPPAPTVDTLAATDITETEVTLNGEITDVGSGDADERGFVWGTTTQSNPGDVAPASSGYDDLETESGTFSAGTFDYALSGLTNSTTYYVRAYAHNGDGYAYGDEISFDTDEPAPFRFTNIPGTVFDAGDTATIWAERLNDMLDRLDALES